MRSDCSQLPLSITCTVRGAVLIEPGMSEGDREFARVEDGESTEDESRLVCCGREPPSKFFGLSLPVGPFPRGGRFAGGK